MVVIGTKMKKKEREIFSQLWRAVVPTTKHEGEWENSSLTSSSYLSPHNIETIQSISVSFLFTLVFKLSNTEFFIIMP